MKLPPGQFDWGWTEPENGSWVNIYIQLCNRLAEYCPKRQLQKVLLKLAAIRVAELLPSSVCYSTRSSLDWRPFLSRDTSRLFRSDWRREWAGIRTSFIFLMWRKHILALFTSTFSKAKITHKRHTCTIRVLLCVSNYNLNSHWVHFLEYLPWDCCLRCLP